MASQYRRFLPEHITYAQKNLLEGQLESLMSVKSLRAYKQLRQEEILQKIRLKKLIEEAKQEIDVLLKILPEPVRSPDEQAAQEEAHTVGRAAIEDELEALRQKIAQLQ